MGTKSVIVFKNFEKPKELGSYYRLLCMTGENKGISYYLNSNRIVLGRGDHAHIQVVDAKSSREHAELKKIGEEYILTDLASQNGIIVNDLKVLQHTLADGDRIIIGKTVYKYNLVLVEDKDLILPMLRDKVEKLKIEKTKKDPNDGEHLTASESKNIKIPVILIALGVGVFFMLDDSVKKVKRAPESINDQVESRLSRDFSSALQRKGKKNDNEIDKKLSILIHRGLREYREKNFFRAIKQFELALVLDSTNGRARFYLSKTKKSLDDEVESLFLKANQELAALKFKATTTSYCSVLRLLQGYPNDERYVDAQNGIKLVENNLGLEEGEIKCLTTN